MIHSMGYPCPSIKYWQLMLISELLVLSDANFIDFLNSIFRFPLCSDHSNVMSSVLVTAKKLSILLQQNGNMAQQPDPFTANILSTWLETHLPVSDLVGLHFFFNFFFMVCTLFFSLLSYRVITLGTQWIVDAFTLKNFILKIKKKKQ